VLIARKGLLRSHPAFFVLLTRLTDVLAILVAAVASFALVVGLQQPHSVAHRLTVVLGILIFAFVAEQLRLYRPWRGRRLSHELVVVTIAVACMVLTVLCLGVTLWPQLMSELSLSWLGVWTCLALILQICTRFAARPLLGRLRAMGFNRRRVALVGFNAIGGAAIKSLWRNPQLGLEFVGYFDDRVEPRSGFLTARMRLGPVRGMARLINEHKIDQVWISHPFRAEKRTEEILRELEYSTVGVRYLLDIFAFKMANKRITDVAGIPMLDVELSPMEGVNRFVKAIEDRVLALLLLLLFSPLMLLIAVVNKLTSPGPVLYRQERVSWNNRPFMMLKFRSMPTDAEQNSGPRWAAPGEKRATRFGALLRRTSLDELPQLINVLRGEMSIVGPRPERPCFVDSFKEKIPSYMKKHMMKAGITGWAQINGWRGDTDLSKRIEYDLFYINNWSVWFDLKIAFMTVFRGFVNKNAY
jgi:putative colanic acid biosynthesis UDP-glucose lipid carrier transferase